MYVVRMLASMLMFGLVLTSGPGEVRAQSTPASFEVRLPLSSASVPQVRDVPRSGSEFWIPLGSIVLPGLGQYTHGAIWPGVGYSATSVAGALVSLVGSTEFTTLPHDPTEQLGFEGAHVAVTAGALSAWDAFHRAMPSLQAVDRYGFLGPREELKDLLTAPVDVRFLTRWTTLLDLAFSAAVAGWVLNDRRDGRVYEPYGANDAAFISSLSLNAAVGEEAIFRGWLLPMLHQKLGQRFWVANGIQAAIFGAGHLAQADDFAVVIGASALYSGWLTRRNDWSVREAIFNHFWYDVLVGTAELLSDEARPISLMPITIRF